MALTLGAVLGGCGGSPVLKLGDDCSHGYYAGGPKAHDPCATAGLVCTFHYNPTGDDGVTCQPAFGSVDGGVGMPCSGPEECSPYGLGCEPSEGGDGGFVFKCKLPTIGQCVPQIGWDRGFLCTHDPNYGGDGLWCVQACETSSDCWATEEHCILSNGQHVCANDPCGGTSGNGLPFQACDNAGTGDGYCVPSDDDGSGSCYSTGLAPAGAFCELGHSAFECAPGSICTFGQIRLDNTICFASCAPSAAQPRAPDGGPGCPIGQTCTQALSFTTSVAGGCVQDCSPSGGTPCPAHTTCLAIEDGGYGCLN
jgi:hypothetical protein